MLEQDVYGEGLSDSASRAYGSEEIFTGTISKKWEEIRETPTLSPVRFQDYNLPAMATLIVADLLNKFDLKQKGRGLLGIAGQEGWSGEGADALSQETAERANQQKLHLKQEVQELLDTAGQEDWDGEGADALAPETVERAKALVDDFPQFVSRISDPDVSASPRGEIDFDWTLARNVMLTISVCPSGEIAFASTDNGTRLSGKGLWARDSLRNSVLACLRELCHESAAATYT